MGAAASLVPLVLLSTESRMGRAGQPKLLQHLSGPRLNMPVHKGRDHERNESRAATPSWQSGAAHGKMIQSPGASHNKHTATKFIIEQITSLLFKAAPFPPQALSGRWQRSINQPKRLEACSPPKSKRRQAGRAAAGRNEVSIISAVATHRL